ncbi:tetrapyrrole methyltransferase and pyrophosphatase domain-containing protein [Lachnospiraceae bacterium JC7]|nr:tetrapyrrole methyltransferase and pyrophosphatase domain-containing protein [Lachnospiraceae bacterium JC7]
MKFELLPVENIDLADYKHDMQEAFQLGAAVWEENLNEEILPESHIDKSLNANGSIAYKAVVDGQMCGGAIVVINGAHGHLDFLYVKSGIQSKGVGQRIWNHIEAMHPEVELWETCTPYFDTRNIHFYINRCGFSAVEFYNPKHIDPNAPEGDDGKDLFFRFEKRMSKTKSELDRLKAVVEKLRSENGCSWDRAQTHSSLKAACIEEAAEVVGGINILEKTGDAANLREELGDLLLQVMFHSVIAEEEGMFAFEDVAKTISDKMVRRHPHVFSGVKYASEEELHEAWAAIKKEEKKGREWEADFLESALSEASELIIKAKERKGFKSK